MLCGDQCPVFTREDIIRYTEPKLGYSRDSSAFLKFVNVLVNFTASERKSFLQFTTGCSSLPPGNSIWILLNKDTKYCIFMLIIHFFVTLSFKYLIFRWTRKPISPVDYCTKDWCRWWILSIREHLCSLSETSRLLIRRSYERKVVDGN